MFAKKALTVFTMAVVCGSLLIGSCETQTAELADRGPATKALPEGFEPVKGTAIHATGYPMEIRCLKDDSVMVFVPAGEFQSGLDDDQVRILAELVAASHPSHLRGKRVRRQFVLGELKPGKLLTAEDLKDLDKRNGDVACALMLLHGLQDSGVDVPHQDLEQWRNEGRTLDSLLAIPMVHDLLRETVVEMVQDLSRDPETVDWLLTWDEPQPGNLLTEADLEELDKQDADRRAAIAALDALQRESADIPAEDLKRWRNGGRTLAGLFAIPAVREGLFQSELRKLKDALAQPVEAICRELRERFPKARKVRTGAFYIDKYEVTNRQYRVFFEQANDPERHPGIWYSRFLWDVPPYNGQPGPMNPKFYDLWSDSKRNADDQPVTCVGREDALTYAKWAGKQVPTRRQWERAAVGDGGRLFPWGSDFKGGYCRCDIKPQPQTRPEPGPPTLGEILTEVREIRDMVRKVREGVPPARVGQSPHDVSPYGCYDMAGNVSERVILAEGFPGKPTFEVMGGNAASCNLQEICPAVKEVYEQPGKLLGLRTILSVERPKE